MKTRIAVGAGLLLTLSTAVAGTLMYGSSVAQRDEIAVTSPITATTPVTPETLTRWTMAAEDSHDYIAPKVPI